MAALESDLDAPASAPTHPVVERLRTALGRLNNQQKVVLAIAVASVISLVIWAALLSKQPDYKTLFSNVGERDGGAIITALEQLNIPYRLADGSGAIQVPGSRVHEVRLRLASQGLPKGGNVGFELMENAKFGISQFAEQVTYQRGLEGELARTIQSIAAVQSARVHLAIPKPSVFIREEQKPTASVLLNLYPGRSLEAAQISGIAHLISSSVPQMPTTNVSIIDQNGKLLSSLKSKLADAGLDPTQTKYVNEVQDDIAHRIENILTPIIGQKNVKVEVAADIDFSQTEQTAETYRPNNQSIRSQQISETANVNQNASGGVPGALTNQPPVPAVAPLTSGGTVGGVGNNKLAPYALQTQPGQFTSAGVNSQIPYLGQPPLSSRKDSTVNFEIDKTVRYTKNAIGSLKRVSAAVVINLRKESGSDEGKPYSDDEMKKINELVKEAMGFSADRGDSVSVVNTSFTPAQLDEYQIPLWKDPDVIDLAKETFKYLIILAGLAIIFLKVIRPLIGTMFPPMEPSLGGTGGSMGAGGGTGMSGGYAGDGTQNWDGSTPNGVMGDDGMGGMAGVDGIPIPPEHESYNNKVAAARGAALHDPKAVASILRGWIEGNG